MDSLRHIPDLLSYVEKQYFNPKALNSQVHGYWESKSTTQMLKEIRWVALGLRKLGVNEKEKVAILAHPSSNWSIAFLAIIMAGGIAIPIFSNISKENFIFQVTQTQAKRIFVGGDDQTKRVRLHRNLFSSIISLENTDVEPEADTYGHLITLGQEAEKADPGFWHRQMTTIHEDDLASIMYTSGSTGVPKGVELSHKNLVGSIHYQTFGIGNADDLYLSVLPLAHIFGLCLNLIMIGWGVSIYYFNDIKNFGTVCRELHPTLVVLVPRLLEKIYSKMQERLSNLPWRKRWLAEWALNLAKTDPGVNLKKGISYHLANVILYKSLREALGSNLRFVISGGAPLNPELCQLFINIGVPIYEGWGMTEACPVAVNKIGASKIGSVGQPYGANRVRIGSDGEILVSGPIVTKGYYLNPEETAAAFDKNGWLKTGDKGVIDDEGYITIVGRLKELLKTSKGEFIAPIPIEQALSQQRLVDMAVVVAEGRSHVICLLYPDFEAVDSLRQKRKMSHLTVEEFLETSIVREEINEHIEKLNQKLNKWEQIHDYRFISHPPTIESGELTPSMKIRRDVVFKKYQYLIDSMYANQPDHHD